MIPYGVKLAWMILCTTGTATSWVVLWAFAKAIDSWWLATTYCVATTFMVFIFDLGECRPSEISCVWLKMDPRCYLAFYAVQLPRGILLRYVWLQSITLLILIPGVSTAQMALVTFSALMIVGVCTVFNLATIISVIMPSKVSESPQV